jgi:hypothetical protein
VTDQQAAWLPEDGARRSRLADRHHSLRFELEGCTAQRGSWLPSGFRKRFAVIDVDDAILYVYDHAKILRCQVRSDEEGSQAGDVLYRSPWYRRCPGWPLSPGAVIASGFRTRAPCPAVAADPGGRARRCWRCNGVPRLSPVRANGFGLRSAWWMLLPRAMPASPARA